MSTSDGTAPAIGRAKLALLVVMAATLVAGCTPAAQAKPSPARTTTPMHTVPAGATASVDPQAWALTDRLSTATFTADTMDATLTGLARSGIATFTDTAATAPERAVAGQTSPFRLLDFQAHALAVGAWAGSTLSGHELDTVVPLPPGVQGEPRTSQLLAAYVGAAATPGGAWSRALMAGQNLLDPDGLRFPTLVLVLFTSDLATGGPQPAGTNIPAAFHPQPATVAVAASGFCSITANWINGMISGLFNSLRLATPGNSPWAIVASIWNFFVSAAQALVNGLIGAVTGAVLGTIRSIAASVATAAEQIASLLPYAVKVTAAGTNGSAVFTLGEQPLPGAFTARVTAGDLPEWPAILSDCAAVTKVALPNFNAKHKPLTWGPVQAPGDPLLAPTADARTEDATDDSAQATWPFQTAADPGDPNGPQLSTVDTISVRVHRSELDDAKARLTQLLFGSIPQLLRPFVTALFAPYINGLQGRVNALLDARGTGQATLLYHGQAPPKPSAVANRPSGMCGAVPGTYGGTVSTTSVETIDVGTGNTVNHDDGSGPVTLTLAADGSATGTWSERSRQLFDEHVDITDFNYHRDMTYATTGTFAGTACDLGLAGGQTKQLTCVVNQGTCRDSSRPSGGQTLQLGAPASASAGHLVWNWTYNSDGDAKITSSLTLTLNGPQ